VAGLFSCRVCLFIDPEGQTDTWLQAHYQEQRLEVVGHSDKKFVNALELAVRFGKTLLVKDLDTL
jgi:dynein heavy chain 2